MTKSFLEALNSGTVLVADGATGTNLQARGLPHGAAPDEWVFDNPEAIIALQRSFIEAGSNIILTDTFGATRLRLGESKYADQVSALNRRAVELARQAVGDSGAFVGGSIGPVGALLKPYGPLQPAQVTETVAEQALALTAGGVDFLIIETQFMLEEAMAALVGARQASDLPIVVSFSYDRGTRTIMGVSPKQMVAAFKPLGLAALGANCGKSLEFMEKVVAELVAAEPGVPIWAKPNAGMPVPGAFPPQYDTTPEQMGQAVLRLVQAGAQIVGGCCGSTPKHVAAIAQAVRQR